jgi:hypothetical protein
MRIFAEWTLIIGDWSVPKWVSWVALIVAGGLALLGLRLGQRGAAAMWPLAARPQQAPRATRGYGLDSAKSISAAATVRSPRCADRSDGQPSNIVANHCVEGGDHFAHHRHGDVRMTRRKFEITCAHQCCPGRTRQMLDIAPSEIMAEYAYGLFLSTSATRGPGNARSADAVSRSS